MKKVSISFLILFLSFGAKAQLDKGTWLAGGTGKFYSYTGSYRTNSVSNTSKSFDIELLPTLGYFVLDKLAVGLRPNFAWNKKNVDNGASIVSEKRLSIGPFARYYLLNIEKQYNLVTDISYQYGVYRYYGLKGTINTFSIMAGPEVFFNETVGLEFLIGYTSKTEDVKNSYKDTRKGVQVAIGFQVHLWNEY